MKKVLMISYFWPPAGGPSIQRVLKFVKYLPAFGWQPLVLTVRDGEYYAIDESLAADIPPETKIYATDSLEPYGIYRKFSGRKRENRIQTGILAERGGSWKEKLSTWVRTNLVIPDARIGWLPFAVREGKRIIRNEGVDLIFSSSPPATTQLIAKKLSRWSGLPWVADFRDPWVSHYANFGCRRSRLTSMADGILERRVLTRADAVTAVSRLDIKEDYAPKAPPLEKYHWIPNGFDESDFVSFEKEKTGSRSLNLVYLGALDSSRRPAGLFAAIRKLEQSGEVTPDNFSITLIGSTRAEDLPSFVDAGLEKYFEVIPYLPHRELFTRIRTDSLLLLLTYRRDNHIPGKLFEYLRIGNPILACGSVAGEAAAILKETGRGRMFSYEDAEGIVAFLRSQLSGDSRAIPAVSRVSEKVAWFQRRNLTERLVSVFDKLVG